MAFWDTWFGRNQAQDINYPDKISDTSFSDLRYQDQGGVHPPLGFPRNTSNLNYNIHRDPPENWRANNAINYSPTYPQPFTPRNMRDISGEIGEYGQRPGEGFNEEMFYEAPEQGFQFPSIFTALANKLKREPNPVLEAELAALQQNKGYLDTGEWVGQYGDRKYDMWDTIPTAGGKLEDIQILRDKNEPGSSAFGSKTFDEAQEKKLAWIGKRLAAGKKVRSDLIRWWQNETGSSDIIRDGKIVTHPGKTAIDLTDIVDKGGTTGGTSTYRGPPTKGFDPGLARAMGSYDRTAGPMSGTYGPYGRAQGGRIGYANGEFVDEDVNIAGPGFDVNENIEMASGGEGDILEQLIAKYIEEGFPLDQAQEMAMQELQQMVAQSGQGEGIASLV